MTANNEAAAANGGLGIKASSALYRETHMWQSGSVLVRVTREQPCPICGRDHWCSVDPNGGFVICMRVSPGSLRATRNGGYLHRLGAPPVPQRRWGRRAIHIPTTLAPRRFDLGELARSYVAAVTPGLLQALADALGVSERSLRRLRAGWAFDGGRARFGAGMLFDPGDILRANPSGLTWSFPMCAAAPGRVVGIRLRHPGGRKTAVLGSHDGLFVPDGLLLMHPHHPGLTGQMRRLFVAEGASDTAALLDLGFDAVGRPSCTGGVRHLTELVSARRPPEVIVVADVDDHGAGQRGAESLASVLVAYCPAVRVVRPPEPFKDLREWVVAGRATGEEIRAAIEGAAVRRLTVRVRPAVTDPWMPHGVKGGRHAG